MQSVKYRRREDIGYVRVSSFTEQTQEGLEKAFTTMKTKMGRKAKGYIIDLRNNPGGLLDQAISVSDSFLDKGEVVSTRGRHPRKPALQRPEGRYLGRQDGGHPDQRRLGLGL